MRQRLRGQNSSPAPAHADPGQAAPPAMPNRAVAAALSDDVKGSKLPDPLRGYLQDKVGARLPGMRVRSDAAARAAATSVGADAITHGRTVHLAAPLTQPVSPADAGLLIHEATHVRFAGADVHRPVQVADHGHAHERAARDAVAGHLRAEPMALGNLIFRGTREDVAAGSAPEAASLIAQEHPQLVGLIPRDAMADVQDVLDVRHHNAKVSKKVQAAEEAHERRHGDVAWIVSAPAVDRAARQYRRPNDLLEKRRVEVATADLLAPTILAPQPWNQAAEATFRSALWHDLSASPTRLWMQDGLEPRPFFGIYWGDPAAPVAFPLRRPATFEDLRRVPQFAESYRVKVYEGPAFQQIYRLWRRIQNNTFSDRQWHLDVDRIKHDHFIRARVAELLGGVSMPGWDMWLEIQPPLDTAFTAILERQIELAGPLLIEAEQRRQEARHLVRMYEHGIQVGVSRAIVALEVAKVAGAVSATILSGGLAAEGAGLAALSAYSAVGAGLYGMAQEGAQQGGEELFGVGGGWNIGAIGRRGAVDAVSTYVGTMVGGALAARLEQALGPTLGRLGLNPVWQRVVVDGLGAAGSAPASLAVGIVTDRILGGELPGSVDELRGMMVDEMVTSTALQWGLGLVTGRYSPAGGGGSGGAGQPLLPAGTGDTQLGMGPGRPPAATGDTQLGMGPGRPPAADGRTQPGVGPQGPRPGTPDPALADTARMDPALADTARMDPALADTDVVEAGRGTQVKGGMSRGADAARTSDRMSLQPNDLGPGAHQQPLDRQVYLALVRDPSFYRSPENAAGWRGWNHNVVWRADIYDIKWREAGGVSGEAPRWGFIDAVNRLVILWGGA